MTARATTLRTTALPTTLLLTWTLLCAALIAPGAVQGEEIRVLTHNSKTFLSRDNGELRGIPQSGRRAFLYELVRAMLLHMGQPNNIEHVPFARGLYLAKHHNNVAFFHIAQTRERLQQLQWVGPIIANRVFLYSHWENAKPPGTVADIPKDSPFCLVRHTTHKAHTDSHGMRSVTMANSYQSCIHMLIAKRVLYTPIAEKDFEGIASQLSPAARAKIIKTPAVLLESQGYIALSKNIHGDIVSQWQNALDHLLASGDYQRLYRTYINPDFLDSPAL